MVLNLFLMAFTTENFVMVTANGDLFAKKEILMLSNVAKSSRRSYSKENSPQNKEHWHLDHVQLRSNKQLRTVRGSSAEVGFAVDLSTIIIRDLAYLTLSGLSGLSRGKNQETVKKEKIKL